MATLQSVARTMAACREAKRYVWKAERWNPYARGGQGAREDFFHFIDIIAIDSDAVVAIQACTNSSAEHRGRIMHSEYAMAWALTGNPIELWCWRKLKKKRGGVQMVWKPKIEIITKEDFETTFEERKEE